MTNSLLDTNLDDTQLDPEKKYLEELVGDGKKFKDPEALAKGKYVADKYIDTLTTRFDEMRTDYEKLREESVTRAKLEELIDQLEVRQRETDHADNQNVRKVEDKPQIDPAQIESLIMNKIKEIESSKTSEQNFQVVQAKIKETLGPNFQAALKDRIENAGLEVSYIDELARKSPTAAIKLLGLEPTQHNETFRSPPSTSQRNDSFSPQGSKKRTWSYYQELKKANPSLYFDPAITVQMDKDAQELGEAFRDGNYYAYGQER